MNDKKKLLLEVWKAMGYVTMILLQRRIWEWMLWEPRYKIAKNNYKIFIKEGIFPFSFSPSLDVLQLKLYILGDSIEERN